MSQCFELLQSVAGSGTAFNGNTVVAVPNQTAVSCYSAATVNTTGNPVVGHLWVPDPATDWFQGVTVEDVTSLSWMVVLVWVAAWGLKVLRRTL